MKKYFAVSFKYSESVYCSNIAHAETAEAVNAHYSRYEWVSVRECEDYEVETARRKGMPIVEIETPEAVTEEPEQKEEETEMTARDIAEKIRTSDIWDMDALAELCAMAGMSDEWKAADGDTFELVVQAAAEKLGVEII